MARCRLLFAALLWLPLVTSTPEAKVQKPVNERLLESAQTGDASTVANLLKEHGAEADAVDAYGTSAMLNAAWAGHIRVVKTLLAHGASVDMQDKGGDYAVLVAQRDPNKMCSRTADLTCCWSELKCLALRDPCEFLLAPVRSLPRPQRHRRSSLSSGRNARSPESERTHGDDDCCCMNDAPAHNPPQSHTSLLSSAELDATHP